MLNYEIKRRITILSANENTRWRKELNLISWNGAAAKYDIRDWSPDHQKLSKGITLTDQEMDRIKEAFMHGLI